MDESDFKSNSNKSKENPKPSEKKIEKVVSGTARQRKKSELRKFADVFVSEDVENVKSYILLDVLVPAVKKAISDIVTNGIDMILYGGSGSKSKPSTSSKVSYRSYYEKSNSDRSRSDSRLTTRASGYDYDEVVLPNRGEAEEVLSRMDELIDVYGMVSVADLYDLVGITGKYTDNKYGWTDIRNAYVDRIRDGYVIKMPKAMPLD